MNEMDRDQNLTVIVPAYNEEEGLRTVLPGLVECCAQKGWDLIVVDDGSSDATAEVASAFSPHLRLIRLEHNQGYGAAIKKGVRKARTGWVATFDADGQHRLEDLIALAEQREGVDAVIGRRTKGSHVDPVRAPGKWILGRVANFLVGSSLPDINCGLRVIRTRAVRTIANITSDRFSFSTSTLVGLIKMGYVVHFAPVMVSRRLGKSTVRQMRDGFYTILLILRLITLFEPLRIMLPLSAGLILLGAAYQIISFFLYGWDIIDTTVLLCLSGVIILAMGLIADQVSALRRELTLFEQGAGLKPHDDQ